MSVALDKCRCDEQDCLPDRKYLTDNHGKSVLVLVCPVCSGQIETDEDRQP